MTIILGSAGGSSVSWTDVRAKVRGDLWRPGNGVSDDVVNRALHAALLEIEAERRWLWNENVQAALTVDVGGNTAFLSAAVGAITALSYTSQGAQDPLTPLPLVNVRELARSSSGSPTFYALGADGLLYFDTTVPAGATFELIFSAQCPEQLGDAVDVFSITMNKHQQAVIALASSYVALTFLKNEQEAARQRSGYERHLDRMMNAEDQKRGGGFIQPDNDYFIAAHGRR